jgi:eukaryotic-like serine/threonine-protein kinase
MLILSGILIFRSLYYIYSRKTKCGCQQRRECAAVRKELVAVLLPFLFLVVVACASDSGDDEYESEIYHDTDPTELALVPAGYFTMGSDFSEGFFDGVPDEPFSDEQPERRTYVSAFSMEIHEVANVQFRSCVDAGPCNDPGTTTGVDGADYYTAPVFDDFPVVNVSWPDADAYCKWRGRRLPTEAEWEKAARGSSDERVYPWGWQEPTCRLANISVPRADELSPDAVWEETCHAAPVRVGRYAASASPYGVTELAGNVAEWTADYYAADYYRETIWPGNSVDPTGPPTGDRRVVRGGGFTSTAMFARVTFRDSKWPESSNIGLGFRCAKSEESETGL